jgi:hypothetical protein
MRTQLVPQSSVGRLVTLHVDGRGNEYPQAPEIPALMPLSVSGTASSTASTASTASTDDNGEKTMLWTNIASLFSKTDHHDDEIQEWNEKYSRSTNDILQELQDIKDELAEVQSKQLLTSQVRKIKKYVSKKCEKMREDINYGSFNADNEIFAYINKMRAEMEQKMTKLEEENAALREELTALHNTYDNDYNTFVERENDLMAKLDAAVQLAEAVSDRVKDCEFTFARRIEAERNATEQSQHTMAGDLREEFVRSITKENEMERKTQLNWLQGVHDELVDLVTRSNEYHSHRYFGLVEQVNKTHDTCQDMCQTLKNSIGMVDAELSETKEKVEFLTEEVAQANNDIYDAKESITGAKDEIFREMDRDYYDLKDYVKRRVQSGIKKLQQEPQQQQQQQQQPDISTESIHSIATNVLNAIIDPIQIVKEPGLQAHEDDHVIIMDESMFQSDSDQDA